MRHALDEAREGRGRLFLVSGEPGIGKTRLAEEIAREGQARGMRVVWGRCWEGEGAPAYWPWIQIIRGCFVTEWSPVRGSVVASERFASVVATVAQIVPELRSLTPHPAGPAGADSEQARFQLFDSVATILKAFAASSPVLLVLDDLHDADEASLAMLRFVARDLKGAPILIVGTHRDAEVKRSAELSRCIGELGREALSIPLGGLSRGEVAEFMARSSGEKPDEELVSRLYAETAGNPLFVDGIVRTMTVSAGPDAASDGRLKIPHTVNEAIRRRLAALSDDARALLNVAAVIGNEFDAGVCARVSGVARDEFCARLEGASDHGILASAGGGRFRFAHSLIRNAIYDALSADTRVRLHREVAKAIEELHSRDLEPHVAALAHHFRAAAETEKAIEFTIRAATTNQAFLSPAVALEHWRAAITLTEGRNDECYAFALLGLGSCLTRRGDPLGGIANLEAAARLFRKFGDGYGLANAHLGIAQAINTPAAIALGMNLSRALEHHRKALEWKGAWKNRSAHGQLHLEFGLLLFHTGRVCEAIEAAKQARIIWEAAAAAEHSDELPSRPLDRRVWFGEVVGFTWTVAAALQAALLTIQGNPTEAEEIFVQIEPLFGNAEEAHPGLVHRAAEFIAAGRLLMKDPGKARKVIETASADRQVSMSSSVLSAYLAAAKVMAGDLEQARAKATDPVLTAIRDSWIEFRRGNWETAQSSALNTLERVRARGSRAAEWYALATLVQIARFSGEFERAWDYLREALETYQPTDLLYEMHLRPEAAMLAITGGRLDEANQHLEICRSIVARGEEWEGLLSTVERAEGNLAAARSADFTTHFEKAVGAARRYALPWEEADTLYDWGLALNRIGDSSTAREKFDAAINVYRRHGAGERWIERIEAAKPSSVPAQKSALADARASADSIFKKEGEFWTVAHQGAPFRLKDSKGLAYMAILLAHPGERFHVKEMVAIVEGAGVSRNGDAKHLGSELSVTNDLGGADSAPDSRAKSDYRRRLKELAAEIDEADRFNDLGRAARAREELELLNAELSSSFGIDGHPRHSGGHAERARLMVGKNIRAALAKIRDANPALGRHLAASISTGYFCSYHSDPEHPIAWQL